MNRFGLLLVLMTLASPLVADQPPTRPRIQGISDVLISGHSLHELLWFYGGILDLPSESSEGYCLSPEGCRALNDHQFIALSHGGTPSRPSPLELIAFEAENVNQLRVYLTAHGGSVWP